MHVRELREEDIGADKPIYAVWEITLRCDHACSHCGSRAARARDDELGLDKLKAVGDELARLGTREVTLIGGEAYLHPAVVPLVEHLTGLGLWVSMQTGGRAVDAAMCKRLADAGMRAIGVSIDGPEPVHDELRGAKGSHKSAVRAMLASRDAGMMTTTNMQLNRLTLPHIREHYEFLQSLNVRAWRTQLTVPMGRAADKPDWILEPYQLLEAIDLLAELQADAMARAAAAGLPPSHAMNVHGSNNLGYYGPHEEMLRSMPGQASTYWDGCPAGRYTIGIESDGVVKACPSLPTAPYTGGNVKTESLEKIWREAPEIAFARDRTVDELWGFCRTCYYADVCRAGCAWTAHCTTGKRGNNPFCYHRAATLRDRGVRERLERAVVAPGEPYDFGRYDIIEEPWPSA